MHSFRDNKPLLKLPFLLDKSLRLCVEMCLGVAALALSSVMAGSGDIDCLRTLRELRWRYEEVTCGTHMALAMAIGKDMHRSCLESFFCLRHITLYCFYL